MLLSIFAISLGAALGAVLRWSLSLWLNPIFPTLPFGTLAANLAGGYLIGVAVAFFAQNAALPPEWRLFAVTGFLGGLPPSPPSRPRWSLCLAMGRWAGRSLRPARIYSAPSS